MSELVKAADRDDRAGDGAGTKRWMLVVTFTQAQEERRDVVRDDLSGLGDAARREEGGVAPEVTAVRQEGVGGESAFDTEVIEVSLDRLLDGCGPRPRDGPTGARVLSVGDGRRAGVQVTTSKGSTYGSPWACATAALTR